MARRPSAEKAAAKKSAAKKTTAGKKPAAAKNKSTAKQEATTEALQGAEDGETVDLEASEEAALEARIGDRVADHPEHQARNRVEPDVLETLDRDVLRTHQPGFEHGKASGHPHDEETADQEQRKAIYSEAIGKIADDAYWAPLFSYSANYLTSPDLVFPTDPDGLPRLQNASWK